MKKLLLIPLLFLITPYAKADMDYICEPPASSIAFIDNSFKDYIAQNCERNNIIKISGILQRLISPAISSWCRHDREINFVEITRAEFPEFPDERWLVTYDLVCVLYDNKPRTVIPN